MLLLEGECVHLPAPKSHFTRDIEISSDVPIFCTSSQSIKLVRGGAVQETETAMMVSRWKEYKFYAQIPENQQQKVAPCAHCFATLVLEEEDSIDS